jgi:hypothetical protein
VGRGFAVEVEDRGLGIATGRLAAINQHLASLPAFDLAGSDRLGLFIAGRLAHRHDIKVALRSSVYGGITAVVIIPTSLVISDESQGQALAGAAGTLEPAAVPALGNGNGHAGNGHTGNDHAGNGYAGNDHAGNGHAGNDHAGNGHPGGLPVRVRQASLAPQLRDRERADARATEATPASAEAVRNTMSAMQRGWELGRSAAAGPPAGAAPDTEGG